MHVICLGPSVELKFKNTVGSQPLFGCESLRLLRYEDVLFIDSTDFNFKKVTPDDAKAANALSTMSVLLIRGIPEITSLDGLRVDCVSTEEANGDVEATESFEKEAAKLEREIVFLEPSEVCDEAFLTLITKE